MTGKEKTKLLKIVCKRTELMRAPFRVSPWPTSYINKKKNKKNKLLLVNPTQEQQQSTMVKSNIEKACSSIQKVSIMKKNILYLRIIVINYYYLIF